MSQTQASNGVVTEENKNQFLIQRVYLKDVSFESPRSPQVFTEKWQPEIKLDLNNGSQKLDNDHYEVVLSLTVTVTNEKEVAYIVEIKQAGIFLIKTGNEKQLPMLIGSYCPNILFPYAREAISEQVVKGGFPPFYLSPVNFDALFAEAVKRQQAEAGASATKH